LLVELANDRDDYVQWAAVSAIVCHEELYQEPALPILREQFQSDNPWRRVHSARGLWRITKDRKVIPSLMQVLRTPKANRGTDPFSVTSSCQGTALSVLGEIARELPELFPDVIAFANDPDEEIRAYAMAEMSNFGERGIPVILKGLDDPDESVRVCSAESLRRMGKVARKTIPRLERMVKEDRTSARASAISALIAIDPRRFNDLRVNAKKTAPP
jgi:HEAT repeat protein